MALDNATFLRSSIITHLPPRAHCAMPQRPVVVDAVEATMFHLLRHHRLPLVPQDRSKSQTLLQGRKNAKAPISDSKIKSRVLLELFQAGFRTASPVTLTRFYGAPTGISWSGPTCPPSIPPANCTIKWIYCDFACL
jgi:hypothetical protein